MLIEKIMALNQVLLDGEVLELILYRVHVTNVIMIRFLVFSHHEKVLLN